jgi:hypothetical protein
MSKNELYDLSEHSDRSGRSGLTQSGHADILTTFSVMGQCWV